jgi:3-deoxy-D-arabino-heptulosonate 7-phosphate (DAHP) synthase class II
MKQPDNGRHVSQPSVHHAAQLACPPKQSRLAKAATGEAFVITGGDCAESFSQFSANRIRDFYRVLLQMSVVLTFGGGVPVGRGPAWASQLVTLHQMGLEGRRLKAAGYPDSRGIRVAVHILQ